MGESGHDMKIAVWHNLPSGGGNRAMYDQVRGLVGRGHHVEIWCPPTANRSFLPLGDLVTEHVVPLDGKIAPRRDPLNRRLHPYHEMVASLDAIDRHCRTCAQEINRGEFDVLLAHASMTFHPTPIGRHVSMPAAIYLQEPSRPLYEAMPQLPWVAPPARDGHSRIKHWKKAFRDLVEVQAKRVQVREELASARDFDLILVNSMFSRESIKRCYGLDSKVCYLGIDIDAFRPTGAAKEGYVVGLGNINENKGLDIAVAALGTIEQARRPELVWVGNYASVEYLRQIEEQARSLGVRFRHKVDVTHEELIETLSRASVMIYTSRLEPFGYAPLEANACGTAVVAIAEGGVRETVLDGLNGTLVGDGDSAKLGQAILEFCSDSARASEVGAVARANVEKKWTLVAALDRLEQNLQWLLNKERPTLASRPPQRQS